MKYTKPSLYSDGFSFSYFMRRALFFGLATLDIQYHVDEFPQGNVKVKSSPPNFFVGGPATNAAVAFAALNGSANLISAVGQNSFRHFFTDDFNTCRVNFGDLLGDQEAQPVLATVVTASNGERNIFTHHPPVLNCNIDIQNVFDKLDPEVLMVDGFYPEVAIVLCREARKRRIPVVFDGGSWKEHLPDLLPLVDYAVCSDDFLPPSCKTSTDVINVLNRFQIKNKVITRGEKSILFADRENINELSIPKVDVVDTLGAGDFFHGAFCYYLLNGVNLQNIIELSSGFASNTCTYKGTRSWINKMK